MKQSTVVDRIAIVVGAGGDIGGACASRLAAEVDDIWCVDVAAGRAEAVATQIRARGLQARAVPADARDHGFSDTVAAPAGARTVATVVWAIAHEEHVAAADITAASIRASFELGPLAAFELFRTLRARDKLGDLAALTVIGSLHAHLAFPNALGYNLAQAALAHLVRTLAHEWAPDRIRVNAVVPGWIRTGGEEALYSPSYLDGSAARMPFGRLGTPQDVAGAVGFLASPEASYISGTFLTVDGGLSAAQAWLPAPVQKLP